LQAIGGTLSNTVSSMSFVLFQHPFDVGDKVSIASVGGGMTMIVESVDILTSTFLRVDGRKVMVPNFQLSGGAAALIFSL
jgi:small-conductance mechanosensitive channel